MWIVTLTYKDWIPTEQAETLLIKKLRELPKKTEHLAVTHGKNQPHHHVLVEKNAGKALMTGWEGRASAHEVTVPVERLAEYLREARLTSFYSSSFEKGPDSDNSASKTGELSEGD